MSPPHPQVCALRDAITAPSLPTVGAAALPRWPFSEPESSKPARVKSSSAREDPRSGPDLFTSAYSFNASQCQ